MCAQHDWGLDFEAGHDTPLKSVCASRHLYENVARDLLLNISNVTVETGAAVKSLQYDTSSSRVTGGQAPAQRPNQTLHHALKTYVHSMVHQVLCDASSSSGDSPCDSGLGCTRNVLARYAEMSYGTRCSALGLRLARLLALNPFCTCHQIKVTIGS